MGKVTYQTILLEIERRDGLAMPFQHSCASWRHFGFTHDTLANTLRVPIGLGITRDLHSVFSDAILLFRNITQAVYLSHFPLLILIHSSQIPYPCGTILPTRQTNMVLHLDTFHRAPMSSQTTDLLSRQKIPNSGLRILLRRTNQRPVRFGEIQSSDRSCMSCEGLLGLLSQR